MSTHNGWQIILHINGFCEPEGMISMQLEKLRKGKEEYLYSDFIQRLVARRSDIDHTVLPANYTMPAFPS